MKGGERMALDIAPASFWRLSNDLRNIWEDDAWKTLVNNTPSGLSISEDDKHVYIEAALPGINPEDVEITFDKGMLWIKGEAKKEAKNRKVYQNMASSFSYRVAVPGDIDPNIEPEATCEHGVMTITFTKSPQSQPKKIAIKGAGKQLKVSKEEKKETK